jgi:hypothetical protein
MACLDPFARESRIPVDVDWLFAMIEIASQPRVAALANQAVLRRVRLSSGRAMSQFGEERIESVYFAADRD